MLDLAASEKDVHADFYNGKNFQHKIMLNNLCEFSF